MDPSSSNRPPPGPLWSTRVSWHRLLLRSVREPAGQAGITLPTSTQHHLVLIAEGTGKLAARDRGAAGWQSLYLLEGDLLFRRAGAPPHELRWDTPAPLHLVHAHLDTALFGSPPEEPLGGKSGAPFLKLRDAFLEHLLRSLDRLARAPRAADARYAGLAAELIALHLVRDTTAELATAGGGGLPSLVLRRVCAHIEAHLGERLGLAELARAAGLSPFYFAREFKAATGQTPRTYVLHRRVAAAERLLRQRELPLGGVALATGFSSQSQLTRAFRDVTGQTPGQYRRSYAAPPARSGKN